MSPNKSLSCFDKEKKGLQGLRGGEATSEQGRAEKEEAGSYLVHPQ